MKRLLFTCNLLLLVLLFSSSLLAQTRGINYQAVARDASNNLITNININLRFTIKDGTGTVYQESQFTTTNEYGLFSVVIGSEDLPSFKSIDWASGNHKVQIELDPGSGFVDLGESILQSVPYSKVATEMSLQDLQNVGGTAPTVGQALIWDGTNWKATTIPAASGPLAYGFVENGGVIKSGSGNYTVAWSTTNNRYEIDIAGENYFWQSYTTQVTASSSSVHRFRTSSVGGKLLVYLHDSSGNLIQGNFQFVTYK